MSFDSLDYILFFIPLAALLYMAIKKISIQAGKVFIIAYSVVFYAYMFAGNLTILITSCLFNYTFYLFIAREKYKKTITIISICFNVIVLAYFKYILFFVEYTKFEGMQWMTTLSLPLALSFVTFQQISFVVDAYRKKITSISVIDYLYYITFFPKLIAGPITRYNELMYQEGLTRPAKSSEIISGLVILSIGLFKKVVMASHFSMIADLGFLNTSDINTIDAWITSFAYTMQIYFDFAGYSDLAIGSALLLGIKLPINFNSPYRSLTIHEFWNRWHISLSTWLRDYVYIPMGGNKANELRVYFNILATFLISGIWHGTGINFILWGALHGIATCVCKSWQKLEYKMPKFIAWIVTFCFINISWIPFRAESFSDTKNMLYAMVGVNGAGDYTSSILNVSLNFESFNLIMNKLSIIIPNSMVANITLAIAMLSIYFRNSNEMASYNRQSTVYIHTRNIIISGIALSVSLIAMFGGVVKSQFIYSSF
ncbi:MBOAT family protein [Aeromonas jandaei]|uniref:MBOAT family O-acyltransferase n=1 Tax=Aeromonas jandaei TaxID=650 RepID=UPI00227B4E43|nr:MBOAT family O-acyltransferase [Aeromonas jandaei]WAG08256.1 MBOAT family protein [Aeromonas jandaei]